MTNLKLVLNDEKLNAAKIEKVEKTAKVITTIVLYAFLVIMALIVLIPLLMDYYFFKKQMKK